MRENRIVPSAEALAHPRPCRRDRAARRWRASSPPCIATTPSELNGACCARGRRAATASRSSIASCCPTATVRHVHQQVEVVERDAGGGALRMAGAVHDVTRRKDAEEQIRRLAYYDALTGLPNRRLITEQLGHAIARAERQRKPVAVMFVDLDNFKRVNDTFGPRGRRRPAAHGRRAPCRGARAGCDALHSIARLGGDEFIVLSDRSAACPRTRSASRSGWWTRSAEPALVQGTGRCSWAAASAWRCIPTTAPTPTCCCS